MSIWRYLSMSLGLRKRRGGLRSRVIQLYMDGIRWSCSEMCGYLRNNFLFLYILERLVSYQVPSVFHSLSAALFPVAQYNIGLRYTEKCDSYAFLLQYHLNLQTSMSYLQWFILYLGDVEGQLHRQAELSSSQIMKTP